MRVFGSVARGEGDENSDVDLLVIREPGRSLLDHARLVQDLQELLWIKVHIGTESLHWFAREKILREAMPLWRMTGSMSITFSSGAIAFPAYP